MGQLHRNYKIKILGQNSGGDRLGGEAHFGGSGGGSPPVPPLPAPPLGEILQTCNKGTPGAMVEGPANFFFSKFFSETRLV